MDLVKFHSRHLIKVLLRSFPQTTDKQENCLPSSPRQPPRDEDWNADRNIHIIKSFKIFPSINLESSNFSRRQRQWIPTLNIFYKEEITRKERRLETNVGDKRQEMRKSLQERLVWQRFENLSCWSAWWESECESLSRMKKSWRTTVALLNLLLNSKLFVHSISTYESFHHKIFFSHISRRPGIIGKNRAWLHFVSRVEIPTWEAQQKAETLR